jgi:WD40 repeat protein
MATGGRIIDLLEHLADVSAVVASADGEHLLTASADGTAILWEMRSGVVVMRYQGGNSRLTSAALAQDERTVVAGSTDGMVRFWDRETGELLTSLHNLDEGFLWTAPPDDAAVSGWFWTDRPALVHVLRCNEDGSNPEVLSDDTPELSVHLELYNRKEMVIGRLNNPEKYQREVERIVGTLQANWLETYGGRLKNKQLGHEKTNSE